MRKHPSLKTPPVDNDHVAPGCEPFASKPRAKSQRGDNPPLHLKMEPSPGSDILDCFDQACVLVKKLGCVVNWDFNEVFCGVRPYDLKENRKYVRALFLVNYRYELGKKTGCKICYAN